MTAEAVLGRLDRLIWREAYGAARRLPRRSRVTVLCLEDLYQEGALAIARAADHFDERRSQMTTYFTAVLRHRYQRLVAQEWRRYRVGQVSATPQLLRRQGGGPAPQASYGDLESAGGPLRTVGQVRRVCREIGVSIPDRYRGLRDMAPLTPYTPPNNVITACSATNDVELQVKMAMTLKSRCHGQRVASSQ